MRTAINCLTHLHERITVHVELIKTFYYIFTITSYKMN